MNKKIIDIIMNITMFLLLLSSIVLFSSVAYRITTYKSINLPVEVYLLGTTQEDDIFIPQQYQGMVDIKR